VPPDQRKTLVDQIETPAGKAEYGEETAASGTEKTLHKQ
jgi:hypothetical protein